QCVVASNDARVVHENVDVSREIDRTRDDGGRFPAALEIGRDRMKLAAERSNLLLGFIRARATDWDDVGVRLRERHRAALTEARIRARDERDPAGQREQILMAHERFLLL